MLWNGFIVCVEEFKKEKFMQYANGARGMAHNHGNAQYAQR